MRPMGWRAAAFRAGGAAARFLRGAGGASSPAAVPCAQPPHLGAARGARPARAFRVDQAGRGLPRPGHLPRGAGRASRAPDRAPDWHPMSGCIIRPARPGDEPGAYHVCLKTGNHGQDGEPLYRDDPDALGRIFVGPYLAFEPELSLILEDEQGICGYALGALDSRAFYARYDERSGARGCARSFPRLTGIPRTGRRSSTSHHAIIIRTTSVRSRTTRIRRTCTSTCCRARRDAGYGRRMMEQVMDTLRRRGSPGAHLGVSTLNARAQRVLPAPRISRTDPHRVGRRRVHLHGDRRSAP